MDRDNNEHAPYPTFWRSRYALGLIVIGGVAAFFLLSQHRAHFLGALPYLLLLACPLMHMFMHHGHGKHKRHDAERGSDRDETQRSQDRQP